MKSKLLFFASLWLLSCIVQAQLPEFDFKVGAGLGSDLQSRSLDSGWWMVGIEGSLPFRLIAACTSYLEVDYFQRYSDYVLPITFNERITLDGFYAGAGIGVQIFQGGSTRSTRAEYTNKLFVGRGGEGPLFAELAYWSGTRFNALIVQLGIKF